MQGTSATSHVAGEAVDTVRAFNRFYTQRFGLLGRGLNGSDYALTEVRVMYELAHADGTGATDLARTLSLDLGYVSRLVKKLHASGLIKRTPSTSDGRQTLLTLTAKGVKVFAPIEQATRDQVGSMLDALPVDHHKPLLDSMQTIHRVLRNVEERAPTSYVIRDPRVGDIAWVIHRQAVLYAHEFGWNAEFEGLLAEIASAFIKKFDPAFEHCWIAERDGAITGAVFLVKKSARVAQLRMLYVEPSGRGLGIGARLVEECIAFARARRYRTMVLWTNDILGSARKIYVAAGFELVRSERHHSFGKDLVGQYWSLDL
jgi:DNA-binding MarR family transcriptional regulator/N-acetylglutamate synthase-like GNAT family acetyltransferase